MKIEREGSPALSVSLPFTMNQENTKWVKKEVRILD